jgi:hypothetical protein
MNVLWIALGIYIAGVALVLFLRPTLMFRSASGAWKEFGLGRGGSGSDDYTLFPFWMFALSWAVISYAAATLAVVFFAASAASAASAAPVADIAANIATPISAAPPPTLAVGTPPPAATVPGYYVLETPASGAPPRYVYFGEKPPTVANLERFTA